MENSTFKLVLTNEGKQLIQNLLKDDKEKIIVSIALGQSSQAASPNDTNLIRKEIMVPASLIEFDTHDKGLHLKAVFTAESSEDKVFDIHEIGVFIEHKQNIFLFGRYASQNILAQKNNLVDFYIDLIIDLSAEDSEKIILNAKDYHASFSTAHATEEKYGIVRLANKEDVLEKNPDRVLSTNALINNSLFEDNWSRLEKIKIFTEHGEDATACGISFLDLEQKKILILMRGDTRAQAGLYYVTYNIDKENKEIKHLPLAYEEDFPSQSVYFNAYYENKISFFMFYRKSNYYENNQLIEIFFPQDLNMNQESESSTESASAQITKKELGNNYWLNSSFIDLNDGKYLLLGGSNEEINHVCFLDSQKKSTQDSHAFDLIFPRKRPLVHIIGSNIYLLGGSSNAEQHRTVEILTPNRQDYRQSLIFAPPMTPIPDINNTEHVFSCAMENSIYIFFANKFSQAYSGERYYYRYNVLAHTWEKKSIPESVCIEDENISGRAISIGKNTLHLFLIGRSIHATKTLYLHPLTLTVR